MLAVSDCSDEQSADRLYGAKEISQTVVGGRPKAALLRGGRRIAFKNFFVALRALGGSRFLALGSRPIHPDEYPPRP